MNILIVEDNIELLEGIKNYLSNEGYKIESAIDFDSGLEKVSLYEYEIVILDLMLPGGTGLDILRKLKTQNSKAGVIIVSAKGDQQDIIEGLNLGADDYLTKPYHLGELNARISSLYRRKRFEGSNSFQFNEIEIDFLAKSVSIKREVLDLTKKEYELLLLFVNNRNRMLTKQTIAEHLWGDNYDISDNFDFIYTHIKNLRRKLARSGCSDYIKSVYGMGYKFSE